MHLRTFEWTRYAFITGHVQSKFNKKSTLKCRRSAISCPLESAVQLCPLRLASAAPAPRVPTFCFQHMKNTRQKYCRFHSPRIWVKAAIGAFVRLSHAIPTIKIKVASSISQVPSKRTWNKGFIFPNPPAKSPFRNGKPPKRGSTF